MPQSDIRTPALPFIFYGAVGVVFKINNRIVLKQARTSANEGMEQEHRIFDILETKPACPHIVRSLLRLPDINFLENMEGGNLEARLRSRQIREKHDFVKVIDFEPIGIVSCWMAELASAVAWLESFGLAHGDIRPANMLLDSEDHLKLADFDCTAVIGSGAIEAAAPPYARLQGREAGVEEMNTYGTIGPQTEMFAIGSVYYYMLRGHEPYEDQRISNDQLFFCKQAEVWKA